MGISTANVALLMAARVQGAQLGNTATLGVQTFWPEKSELDRLLSAFHFSETADFIFNRVGSSGSQFLEFLGASQVTEFDASDYEGAKVLHDMNLPLSAEWHNRFDFVYDGGCIEHIFDVAQVIKNLHSMVVLGGHLVISTTGNNLMGHGFYQFSPEFFFRVFSAENGWNTKLVLLAEHKLKPPRFWLVSDPKELKSRIEIENRTQLYTMIITQKVARANSFIVPQQSDYFAAWSANNASSCHPELSVTRFNKPYLRRLGRIISPLVKAEKWLVDVAKPALRRGVSSTTLAGIPGIRELTLSDMANFDCG